MLRSDRRQFLFGGAAALATTGSLGWLPSSALAAPAALNVVSRVIEVNGKAAKVYGIVQQNGAHGLIAEAGQRFQVSLKNDIDQPTLIHWHGLTPPSEQDGVPDLSQPVLMPGKTYAYDFALTRPGTNWMHSHVGFQEQQLMAAPLIVRDPRDAGRDEQEVVVLFHDFTFRQPEEIFRELTAGMAGMDHNAAGQSPVAAKPADPHAAMKSPAAPATAAPDLNDIQYDAYLANDRTLADPEIVRVESGGQVRLRLINGAASTNFMIDLGTIEGELLAVDGIDVRPIRSSRFEFAVAQRLDIRLRLPTGQGSFPILAIREGDVARTGVVLATSSAKVARLAEKGSSTGPVIGADLERRLVAAKPLADRTADRILNLDLTGDMAKYVWTLNDQRYGQHTPLAVRTGERVEIIMRNRTGMSHPMHLHGHHFQVLAIGDQRFRGAVRDTALVPANTAVTIAFDADNPGHWAFHCHNSYHMAAGMMTTIKYSAVM